MGVLVSYINPEEMGFRDGRDVDAFHRLRTSEPHSLFSSFNEYGGNTREFVTLAAGTGSSTFLPNEASLELSTGGTASGAGYFRQTRLAWQTTSGRSLLIYMSQLFGTAVTNARKRVGWFDNRNGIILEQTTVGVRLIKRTDISGSVDDSAVVEQANWNIDPLNGTGPSGFTIDWTRRQTMFMDIQYTGTGRGRVGFVIGGVITYCHEFSSGNVALLSQIRTPNLPLRMEIENTGVASGTATMKITGMSISVEGDPVTPRGALNCCTNGITEIGVTTRRPILSFRPKATYNGLPNRAWVIPYEYGTIARTNNALVEIVTGHTLTGAVWNSVSLVEFDVTATAVTGGGPVITGFCAAGSGSNSTIAISGIIDNYPQTVDALTSGQLIISMVATAFSGTSNVSGFFNWREVF
jgi:hypothetical protein